MTNQLLHPRTPEELCNLLKDLHTTICAELSAFSYAQPAGSYAVDMIKLTTATLHMLYLVNQEESKIPVLWSPDWIDVEDDRFYQVLNGLQLFSNPISTQKQATNGMDWRRSVNLCLSEILLHLYADCNFEVFSANIGKTCRLLGFTPESKSSVTYQVVNLKSRKELFFVYTKRFH